MASICLMSCDMSLGCADIVSCIMAALENGEVKRTRRQIVNQLVHQELVEDKRLLLKKPSKKKKVVDDTFRECL